MRDIDTYNGSTENYHFEEGDGEFVTTYQYRQLEKENTTLRAQLAEARNGFANLISDFQELNLGNYLANYTDDDVRRMNDWAIEAYTAMKGGE